MKGQSECLRALMYAVGYADTYIGPDGAEVHVMRYVAAPPGVIHFVASPAAYMPMAELLDWTTEQEGNVMLTTLGDAWALRDHLSRSSKKNFNVVAVICGGS